MFLNHILFLLFSIIIQNEVSAETVNYEGHQLWRVTPEDKNAINILMDIGDLFQLDFWKDPVGVGIPVDFRVPPSLVGRIRNSLNTRGLFDIEIVIPNIQSLINQERERRGQYERKNEKARLTSANSVANFDYTVYHTTDEIYQWMDLVVSEYPTNVTKKQVGVTYQGRPIYVLEFKNPSSSGSKPTIYVDSLIHSREWVTAASLMFIFKEMLQNPEFSYLLEDVNWYFIPIINVDGYVETWTGDRFWRKTRSTGASSICTGVDGNRNWDSYWSKPGASGNPCSIAYYGPTAFSESEIRHISNYIMSKKDEISAVVTVHSYSQLILYPWGGVANVPAPDDELLNITGKGMSDAIFAKYGKRYIWGPAATTIYVASGVTTDWTYEKAGIALSYAFELRDDGTYGFLLPEDQIIPNGEEFLMGFKWLADYLINNDSGSSD